MRLHIRECACGRFAIRIEGEHQWCRWLKGGYVEDVCQAHEVLSRETVECESCRNRTTTHIALTAGAVH